MRRIADFGHSKPHGCYPRFHDSGYEFHEKSWRSSRVLIKFLFFMDQTGVFPLTVLPKFGISPIPVEQVR